MSNIIWFKDCSYKNKGLVGGKNSSLGELYNLSKKLNFQIANGFAITTKLYDNFIETNKINSLIEQKIFSVNENIFFIYICFYIFYMITTFKR